MLQSAIDNIYALYSINSSINTIVKYGLMLCFFILDTNTSNLEAQESIGIIHDNYVPTQGMQLNPSSIVDSKPWLNVNLIGVGVYARNNFTFIRNSKLQEINENVDYAFDYNPKQYQAYANAEVLGPAATMSFGEFALGFHTAVKTFGSAKKIPGELGEILSQKETRGVNNGIYEGTNMRAKAIGWGEIGFTYGKIFKRSGPVIWTASITVKRLFGFYNTGVIVRDAVLEIENDEAEFLNLDGSYFITEPSFNAGRGWGTSLGMTYKKMKGDASRYIPHSKKGGCMIADYEYKIGASLIDVGNINFNTAAETGTFNETIDMDEFESVLSEIDPETPLLEITNGFRANLPAAFSVQFDYNLNDKFYANGTIIQKLSLPKMYGAERDNLLAASIRYESKWLGIGLPVTLQNYRYVQLGFALRGGPIIIGSDHIMPFLIRSDIYASDIYFALQFPFMRNPKCKMKKEKKAKKKKTIEETGIPPCPKF